MIRTWKRRVVVLLTAAPLLGIVPMATGAHAAEGAVLRTASPRKGVVLRTASPKKGVLPGRTYTWAFKVYAKGPAKSRKAVFWATLPKTLEFVSGKKHCKSKGRKVVCRLGKVRKGGKAKGVIRAKVSGRAEAGQKITFRGKVKWGRARTARAFPAVRVAGTADPLLTELALAAARTGAKSP